MTQTLNRAGTPDEEKCTDFYAPTDRSVSDKIVSDDERAEVVAYLRQMSAAAAELGQRLIVSGIPMLGERTNNTVMETITMLNALADRIAQGHHRPCPVCKAAPGYACRAMGADACDRPLEHSR